MAKHIRISEAADDPTPEDVPSRRPSDRETTPPPDLRA